MRRNASQLFLLAFLLFAVGLVFWRLVLPQWTQSRRMAELNQQQAQAVADARARMTPTPIPTPPPKLTTVAVLADGSFNVISPVKNKLADDPASLTQTNNWRARYEPILARARPKPDQPGFYVYTFLDNTPQGIGVQFTYGWHLVGSAALECWTDARVTGDRPPTHYGLPNVDEESSGTQARPGLDEWLAQALGDSATAGARYIISGAYESAPQSKCVLTVKMVDRLNPSAPVVLCAIDAPGEVDFVKLAAHQREAARAITGKLIEMKAAGPREPPKLSMQEEEGLSLDKELGWVARMLDSNDSWAMMDGIDQALALQLIFPKHTQPLQAACYGSIALEWAFCDYADANLYGMDYIMRAFALAQIAAAIDPKPSLTQLNWIYGTAGFGLSRVKLVTALTGADVTRTHREIDAYRRFVMGEFKENLAAEQVAMVPDWQVLWVESQQTRYAGTSDARDYFKERVASWQTWPAHDLFFETAVVEQKNWNYETAKSDRFASLANASLIMTRQTAASELAAILSTQRSGTAAADISEMTGIDAGLLRTGDYYALRTRAASSFAAWEYPYPGHPVFGMLKWMDRQFDSIALDRQFSQTAAGFSGFEFTPLERVRFAQRRDHLGPLALAQFEADRRLVFDDAMAIGSAYFSARPENAAAHSRYAGYMARWAEKGDALLDQWVASRQVALDLFPIEQENYLHLARTSFYADRQQVGLRYVREYLRQSPYSISRNQTLAELLSRYGYHALAVPFFDEALKEMPKRYDIANERAWSLIEMGHAKDPEIRRTFAFPVHELSGNGSFHATNLRYLFYWDEDMKAARDAALFYRQCKPTSLAPTAWLIRIELKDGNTSAALRWLKQAPPPEAMKPVELANYYAQLAGWYLDLNMARDAEAMIAKAADIEPWDSHVIDATGRYYYTMGDYEKALGEYRREYERFGPSVGLILSLADCLDKKGMKDEAYRLLEDQVAKVRRGSGMVELVPKMMEYYAERGEKEKARDLMNFLLNSGARTRTRISDTLNSYRKLFPRESEEIWKRIDDIMAGPKTIG